MKNLINVTFINFYKLEKKYLDILKLRGIINNKLKFHKTFKSLDEEE